MNDQLDGSNANEPSRQHVPAQLGAAAAAEIRWTLAADMPAATHLEITDEVARGSMGHIHLGEDRRLLRRVAVKRLDGALADQDKHRNSLIAEAQITGQLTHPNVVSVHEIGMTGEGVPYFTMNLVAGVNFETWLRDPAHLVGSQARLQDGIEILLKVCDAVAYAHSRGVIHRDLKPENVMVADFGQVYVIDWGLACCRRPGAIVEDSIGVNVLGAVGTPTHMAPEQARGNPRDMDERSDVFGLGAILYEVLSDRSPYGPSLDGGELLCCAWNGRVVPIDQIPEGARAPAALRRIVEKAVAADPADRHQSVVEFQRELRTFLFGGLRPCISIDAAEEGSVIVPLPQPALTVDAPADEF